jgi:type IV secretion system protein VirB3
MKNDIVFKGCMRPQMFMGVPMMPFMIVNGFLAILGSAISLWIFLTIPICIFIMQQLVRRDELYFSLVGVRFLTRFYTRGCYKSEDKSVVLSSLDIQRNNKK